MGQIPSAIQSEHLLLALRQCGDQLDTWISESPANACMFIEDPTMAMQAAGPDLDLDVMLELEAVLSGLVQKLDLGSPTRLETDLDKAS
jgi:hypothetical protein